MKLSAWFSQWRGKALVYGLAMMVLALAVLLVAACSASKSAEMAVQPQTLSAPSAQSSALTVAAPSTSPAGVSFGVGVAGAGGAGFGGGRGGNSVNLNTAGSHALDDLGATDKTELLIVPREGGAGGGGAAWRFARGTARATEAKAEGQGDEVEAGSPTLMRRDGEGKLVTIPLKHTDVSAAVTGYVASVGVTQQYTNPYAEKIEAVYVFPLPENAGVNEFVMTIGERHIRGIIREKEEAEKLYKEAKAQGYVASLMSQERPNVFTQKVANIEPGKQIDISIRYFHTLSYQDGWFEWVFPMVVGPRYNPAGTTDGVGAVGVGEKGKSGQKTEVQYLRPEERSGHDIALTVSVNAGMAIEEIVSVNHKVSMAHDKNTLTVVTLAPSDAIPNKDFVLRWKVAGDRVKSAMFVQKGKDGKDGWFTLMLVPPEDLKSLPRRAVEMVFVVDTSGSMSGRPIAQAKAAVDSALGMMVPGDTFQIVKFASGAEQWQAAPVTVNGANVAAARQYVQTMAGDGGTEMLKGINAALDFPHDENRTRVVAFLTDGYIGNEVEILKALHAKLMESRVFSFGVGSSPNRYLLDAMARLGHGSAAYLSLNEEARPVMEKYFERISHPALANLKVNFGGAKVSEVYPQRLPELFVGRPIVLCGRYTGAAPDHISVTGSAGSGTLTFSPAMTGVGAMGGAGQAYAGIATVWARARLGDLHDEAIYEGRDVIADVRATALTYGLVSEFTSFVAVDSTMVTKGDHGTSVMVPVPVPDGVRYETTVGE